MVAVDENLKLSLEKNLLKRPSINEIAKNTPNYIKNSKISSKLLPIQLKLNKQFKKDKLTQFFQKRPSYQELKNKGIIIENSLIYQAKNKIEKLIIKQNLEKFLRKKQIPTKLNKRKASKSVDMPDFLVAPKLESIRKQLEKRLLSDQLTVKLSHRKSIPELQMKGIYKNRIDCSARKLEQKFLNDKLNRLIEKQNKNSISTLISPRLQRNSRQIELQLIRNQLKQLLEKRPSLQQLKEQKIIPYFEEFFEDSHILDRDNEPSNKSSDNTIKSESSSIRKIDVACSPMIGSELISPHTAATFQVPASASLSLFDSCLILLRALNKLYDQKLISYDQRSFLKNAIVSLDIDILQLAAEKQVEKSLMTLVDQS